MVNYCNVSIRTEVKPLLKELAEQQYQSVSSYLSNLIRREYEEHKRQEARDIRQKPIDLKHFRVVAQHMREIIAWAKHNYVDDPEFVAALKDKVEEAIAARDVEALEKMIETKVWLSRS